MKVTDGACELTHNAGCGCLVGRVSLATKRRRSPAAERSAQLWIQYLDELDALGGGGVKLETEQIDVDIESLAVTADSRGPVRPMKPIVIPLSSHIALRTLRVRPARKNSQGRYIFFRYQLRGILHHLYRGKNNVLWASSWTAATQPLWQDAALT